MKGARFVFLLASGFLVRSVVLLIWGSGGLSDYAQVARYRQFLETNLEDLKRINSDLRRELDALSSDPQSVALAARELGYFRDGERVFRFAGSAPISSSYTLGSLVRSRLPPERPDWAWKLAGLAVPIMLYLVGLFLRRRSRHESRGH
jgi:cell division protein FtsB